MGLMVSDSGGGDFQLAPEGTHRSMCYMVVDLGMQPSNFGPKHKVMIGWELTDEPMDDGRPFTVSARYTASLNEKANLRQHLEAWRGRKFTDEELAGFDVFNVLGVPCLVTVTHNHNQQSGKTYANVTSVTALPKSMQKPERQNELLSYSLDDPNPKMFSALPEWIQKLINERIQSNGAAPNFDQPPAESYENDTPF